MRLFHVALVTTLLAGCGALPCPDVAPGATFAIEGFHTVTLPTGECRNVSVRFGGAGPLDTCPARVCVHDALRRHLATQAFSAGHATAAHRVALEYHGGAPYLVLETLVARQLYAIRASDIVLVRLEGADGKALRNSFRFTNHTIGPPVPLRTWGAWAAALGETDRIELLRSLVWWGALQTEENRRQVARLLRREDVRAALARLAASRDKWIAEAAALALSAS